MECSLSTITSKGVGIGGRRGARGAVVPPSQVQGGLAPSPPPSLYLYRYSDKYHFMCHVLFALS